MPNEEKALDFTSRFSKDVIVPDEVEAETGRYTRFQPSAQLVRLAVQEAFATGLPAGRSVSYREDGRIKRESEGWSAYAETPNTKPPLKVRITVSTTKALQKRIAAARKA